MSQFDFHNMSLFSNLSFDTPTDVQSEIVEITYVPIYIILPLFIPPDPED